MISSPRNDIETAVATLETDEQTVRKIEAIFSQAFAEENLALASVESGKGRWTVSIHFPATADANAVRAFVETAAGHAAAAALTFERVAARDWVRASLAGLPPVRAGRFVVHGAHDRAGIARNRIGIEIEAALAFGTGHHGTTRGCLLALDAICKSPAAACPRGGRATGNKPHILDLGTGSGVLAIAAARALRRRVLATDVDAEAVRVARDNARLNGAGALIAVTKTDGVARRTVRMRAPFDLVFANVLLGPLQRFAAPLIKLIAPGGRIILSGLLRSQANAALSAYRPLALERRIDLDGWTTLVLRRGRAPVAPRRRHS